MIHRARFITSEGPLPQESGLPETGLPAGDDEDPRLFVRDPNHAPIRFAGVRAGNGGNVEMPRSSSDSWFPPGLPRNTEPLLLRTGGRGLSSSLLS